MDSAGRHSPKRKAESISAAPRKMAKTMSFAERMMAKMGHEQGRGLGRSAQGIVNPIEVNSTRPAKVGLGMVKEKTQQAKDDARRQAEARGDSYEPDTSEEEKAQQRKAKAAARKTGSKQPKPPPKVKYRTAAEGLAVPQVLKEIIDATGPVARTLDSAAGLMKPAMTAQELEAHKLATRARRDVEAFAASWNELTARAKALSLEEEEVAAAILQEQHSLSHYQDLVTEVEQLASVIVSTESLELVMPKILAIETKYADIDHTMLQQICASAVRPLFTQAMATWSPLEDPVSISPQLDCICDVAQQRQKREQKRQQGNHQHYRQKATTPYETLIYTLWLPRVRSAIMNDWDPYDPTPLLSVLEAWTPYLPDFVLDNLVNTLIVRKLTATLHAWNPRTAKARHTLPHVWVFPWLPHLAREHTSTAASATGLLSEVSRKLRIVLIAWDISVGLVPGIQQWVSPLGASLERTLLRYLLPRLAQHLSTQFQVDPADQQLAPLECVLAWHELLPERAVARLLVVEFFPKWLGTLHEWLSSEGDDNAWPDLAEVAAWYRWWKQQIPEYLWRWRGVNDMWTQGLRLMLGALELGPGQRAQLQLPDISSAIEDYSKSKISTPPPPAPRDTTPPPTHHQLDEEASLRDVVEAWCEEQSLLLMPVREAHANGSPLYRITASATGRGGVLVYFKGDLVWARQRGNGGTVDWEQVALDGSLAERAERK